MTKQEAIKQLQGMVVGAEWLSGYMIQALSIAIETMVKAEEQEQKREDALQAIAGLLNVVEQIDSADVVEVVRCKNCKHHEELLNNNDGNVLCWVQDIDVIVDRNGYCNYGERKEQEHERR